MTSGFRTFASNFALAKILEGTLFPTRFGISVTCWHSAYQPLQPVQLNQAKIITAKCLSRMHYNVSIARFERLIIAIVHGAPAHFTTFLTSLDDYVIMLY